MDCRFKNLENFIKGVRKKYGKKADSMRVELHVLNIVDEDEFFTPKDIEFLGVANYKADKVNGYPSEKVVVIR